MEEKIKFKSQLIQNDIVAFNIYLLRKRGIFMLIIYGGISLILISLLALLILGKLPENMIFTIVILTICVIFFPIRIYRSSIKYFKNYERLQEKMTYEINREVISCTGYSFNSILTWDKIYNMTESKKYFFIWQKNNSAYIIPKRFLTNDDVLFLQNIKDTKFKKK